jgi:hypothetical protein
MARHKHVAAEATADRTANLNQPGKAKQAQDLEQRLQGAKRKR